MDSRDVKTLQILEEIAHDDTVSQRTLAEKMDVSLGLVNSFVKHLTAKGFFKAKTIKRDRVKYMLTPEGAAEKTRLAYDYIKYSFDLYKKSYGIIHDMLCGLSQTGVKTVVLYGLGAVSEMIAQEVNKLGISIVAVIDDIHKGRMFHGIETAGLEIIPTLEFDRIIVTVIDNQSYSIEKILNAGIGNDVIVTLDQRKTM